MRNIGAVREGRRWAIKHGAGYLGHVDTEAEAWALVSALRGSQAGDRSAVIAEGTGDEIALSRPNQRLAA
jgi:hypothetical protein